MIIGAGGRMGTALARRCARTRSVIAFKREHLDVLHPERVRAALRMARGEEIDADDLQLGSEASDEVPSFRDAKRAFERDYVGRVLRLCGGNISRAARIAKKDRKDFYDVLRRNGIDPDEFR